MMKDEENKVNSGNVDFTTDSAAEDNYVNISRKEKSHM